jgi:molybdenum cofactor cytidylyltransferase
VIFATRAPAPTLTGAILAHSLRLPSGLIAKGSILTEQHLAVIEASGIKQISIAMLESGDCPEADAARRLGAMLAGFGLRAGAPVHGRVNLFAVHAGILVLQRDRITALNMLNEAITLATLPDATGLTEGEMVATLKIIPFAVPEIVLAQAAQHLAGSPALLVQRFRPLRVGLVLSQLPHVKDSVITATIAVTKARVEARGGHLLTPHTKPHETGPLEAAVTQLLDDGAELILIAGASAVTDRGDVAPGAIVAAGGTIERFGMPVDPGNLLCFGRIGSVPAIVLPGCARSPKLNGIDFVLDRAFAGVPLDSSAIAKMGVGGLLKDFAARPSRRQIRDQPRTTPKIAAIILAAGKSSRAAPRHKLLSKLRDGRSLIETTVDHALAAGAHPVIVVTGHAASLVQESVQGREILLVHAAHYDAGLAESLKAGIAALPEEVNAALICLGDMPLVDAAALRQIIAAYDPDEGRTIIVPTHRGKRGNPVLWDRRFFPLMAALNGDEGARSLFALHPETVAEVAMADDAVLRDFDTIEALEALERGA